MYNKIIHSAPEGPDGMDDWTREERPMGRAKIAVDEFLEFYREITVR